MEVLDEPGIIEVDRRRQAAHLPQHVIAELALYQHAVAIGEVPANGSGAERPHLHPGLGKLGDVPRIAARDQHGFQSRPRQAPRELEVADTDPRHLLANRLATDERHSRHRPGALAGEAAGLVLDATLLAE